MNRQIQPLVMFVCLLLVVLAATGLFLSSSRQAYSVVALANSSDLNMNLAGETGVISHLNAEPTTPAIRLATFATGLSNPVGIANSGLPGDGRLFIVQQGGQIRVVQADGSLLPVPFLDISDRVSSSYERGFLGLVFHPDYGENGYFYVNYTDTDGHTQVVRYSVSNTDPNLADPDSAQFVLSVSQPFSNHNGGDLKFGPDGFLYIGLGDGGSSGDPGDRSQNMGLLLGKMLRIDVDMAGLDPDCGSGNDSNYSVPADNPFVGVSDTCNEIWASGLRNPWRYSFDRLLGDLYIADVGQGSREEVNWQPTDSPGGENYGWRCYEGNIPFNLTDCGPKEEYTFPIHDYDHSQGDRAITGGFVYRGSAYPALWGHYLFGDFISGRFWALYPDGEGGWQLIPFGLLLEANSVSSFGEDVDGELYVSHRGNGTIYRIQENNLTPRAYLPYIENG
jgi:glucose/arabinose dehydrogenase